jgi:hypothetical protein
MQAGNRVNWRSFWIGFIAGSFGLAALFNLALMIVRLVLVSL